MRLFKLLLVCTLLCSGGAFAETAYVTDVLQLGLYASEDASDAPFRTLVSGSELEVLTRRANFAEVVTADGDRGWVKSAYLVSEKPARLKIAEADAEVARLQKELDAARDATATAEAERQNAIDESASAQESSDAMTQSLMRLKAENQEYEADVERYRGSLPWPWVAGALGAALLAGFVLGLWTLDAVIRRRHGGFRVY